MAYSYKGAIEFGLVYIPVTLSSSIKQNDIGFNMLDKKTMSRVKYKKTCVDCGGREVKNEDIVKGYQYEKDKYVVFDDKDFEKLKTEKDKNICIESFLSQSEVSPIFFDKTYYVKPAGGEKAYFVLLNAMQKQKKVALAKTVIGTKETLLILSILGGKMIATSLFFNDEIVEAPQVKKVAVTKKESDLANSLITQMTAKFEPSKYKDEYIEKVKKAIKSKIAGKEIIQAKNDTKPTKVINIMEALQKSLNTKPTKKKVKDAAN
ncbi:MAG: Ku protein [Clostridiales bacterium]|nr:Ku protein [Clostridiales bacterium]